MGGGSSLFGTLSQIVLFFNYDASPKLFGGKYVRSKLNVHRGTLEQTYPHRKKLERNKISTIYLTTCFSSTPFYIVAGTTWSNKGNL